MATLNQVRTAVDNRLANLWPSVTSAQTTYHNAHGRFWQGRVTSSLIPAYTAAVDGSAFPDAMDDHPTDIPETWRDLFPSLPSIKLEAQVRMDIYNGPLGDGYVGIIRVRYATVLYERGQNVGPETFRTVDWHAVDESGG